MPEERCEPRLTPATTYDTHVRGPHRERYHSACCPLQTEHPELPFTLKRIGDCEAPAIIAAAVYAGHTYARELDAPADIDLPMKHDRVNVGLVASAQWM